MHFNWIDAMKPVLEHAWKAKARVGDAFVLTPAGCAAYAFTVCQVLWGQHRDLLLVVYLRCSAQLVPRASLEQLCEAGLGRRTRVDRYRLT